MTIKELQNEQKEIKKLIVKKLGKPSYSSMLHCLKAQEELGEVADVLIRIIAGSRKGKLAKRKGTKMLGKEIADTICCLIGLANNYDIDLDSVIQKKIKTDRKRYS